MKKILLTTSLFFRIITHFVFSKRSYCFLILCLFFKYTVSQSLRPAIQKRIDSLKTVLLTEKLDTNKLKILNSISMVYVRSAGFEDSAIKYAKIMIDITDRAKCNPYWKGNALSILGIRYSGNAAESLKYHFAALKLRRQIQDKQGISASLYNIGYIYSLRMGYYTEARRYQLESLKFREDLMDSSLIRVSYDAIGDTYREERKYNEALSYYLNALKIKRAGSDLGAFRNIGICYCNLGKYDEGLKFLFDGLRIAQTQKDDINTRYISVSIGNCYAKHASTLTTDKAKEKYEEALVYLNKGLEVSRQAFIILRDVYSGLSETYAGLHDYEKALLFTNLHKKYIDSINSSEMRNRIEQLRIEYENEMITVKENANQEKILLQEKALREKLLADERAKQELKILQERNTHDLALKEERFMKEKNLAEEKARFENAIALEKADHEQKQLAKRQVNTILIMGLIFSIIIFVLIFYLFRQKILKKRAIERADAFRKMSELELQSLRAQLNPHFIFNSLNAIQELILREDNNNSHLYLSRFSELLRMLLDNANQPFVSLRKELNLLELYLSLEKLRIPDIEYTIEIDKAIDTNKVAIPNMILQPYIENAIWHGLSNKEGEKNLSIKIDRRGDSINCEIADNGVGRKAASELKSLYRKEHRSKGMELLSKRFNILSEEYSSKILTAVEDLHDNGTATGTKISIVIPLSLTNQSKYLYS